MHLRLSTFCFYGCFVIRSLVNLRLSTSIYGFSTVYLRVFRDSVACQSTAFYIHLLLSTILLRLFRDSLRPCIYGFLRFIYGCFVIRSLVNLRLFCSIYGFSTVYLRLFRDSLRPFTANLPCIYGCFVIRSLVNLRLSTSIYGSSFSAIVNLSSTTDRNQHQYQNHSSSSTIPAVPVPAPPAQAHA